MKTYQLTLTEQELDIVLKTLDATQTRGIETQRAVVALADKLVAARAFAPPHAVPTEEVA